MKTIVMTLLLVMMAVAVSAQPPETMNYQGALTDAGGLAVPDGNYNLTFRIYDQAAGGAALWSEAHNTTVTGTIFSVILGSANPLSLPFDEQYWLSIQVSLEAEMSPRTPLTSVPYALNIADGKAVTSLEGLTDDINLVAGSNITINTSGQNITIAGSGAVSDNDWAVTGNDLSMIPSGNVGIGVGPTAGLKLDVGGDVRAGTSTTPGAFLARNGDATNYSIFGGSFAGKGSEVKLVTEDGGTSFILQPDFDGTGGFFQVNRSDFAGAFTVDGNFGGSESPRVVINGLSSSMVFNTDATGDASVSFPTDAISSSEILDEPGLASSKAYETSSYALTTSLSTLTSRTITCPSNGYVFVLATYEVDMNHTAGSAQFSTIGISDNVATLPNNQDNSFYLPGTAAAGVHLNPGSGSGIFPVTAGANTFYLNGYKNSGTADIKVWDVQLNVMFFPTAYGTVEGTANALAGGNVDQFSAGKQSIPGPTAGDLAAEKAESEAFVRNRVNAELATMQSRLVELQQEIKNLNSVDSNR